MTATTTRHLSNVDYTPGKALNVTLWIIQALLALAFLAAGGSKLIGRPDMVALFAAVGIGQWFRYVTGLLEVIGAVLIVLPKTRSLGALLFVPIMVGAIAVNIMLHATVVPPLALLLLSSVVVWGRRRELAQFIPASAVEGKKN